MISWTKLLQSIEEVSNSLHDPNDISDEQKQFLLNQLSLYKSNENDFKQFIAFDEKSFTKNLVMEVGDICNIIIMCWAPGQGSSIHSHNGSQCFVKILKGQLNELKMSCPNENRPIVQIDTSDDKRINLTRDMVTYIDDYVGTHQVRNESPSESAISLHVYMPPYKRTRVFVPILQEDVTKLSLNQSKIVELDFYDRLNV